MKPNKKTLLILSYLACLILAAVAVSFAAKGEQTAYADDKPTYAYSPSTGVNGELGQFKTDGVWYYVAKKPEGGKNGKAYAAGCSDDAKEIRIPALVKRNGIKYKIQFSVLTK